MNLILNSQMKKECKQRLIAANLLVHHPARAAVISLLLPYVNVKKYIVLVMKNKVHALGVGIQQLMAQVKVDLTLIGLKDKYFTHV
jgi:hypothetical protein